MRDFQRCGRSPTMAMNGMAATSHTLSTQVAIDVLKAGGNAMDGAIAASAMQCVVEPGSTGIGGDCFAMFSAVGGEVMAYNGSGRAPGGATLEKLTALGVRELTRTSPHSVIVPGAVDAWTRLNADHGRMTLAELLAPAIDAARNGYAVSQRVQADWTKNEEHLRSNKALAAIFLPGGKVPAVGSVHHQPALANTLEAIGREGRDAFYAGAVAEEIVETLNGLGGLHTLEDFARAKGDYVTTITTEFGGHTVHECPPNGQGIIALLLLNILREAGPLPAPHTVERMHLEIEACRRAYAVRGHYLADPDQADVPVERLKSREFARQLFDDIDPKRAKAPDGAERLTPHHDTVYISVVDKERNAVSFINTLFWGWGGGITAPKSGVVLTNRGEGFVLREGHPNCIAPNKRPLHTIIPAMLRQNGRTTSAFGVMGGEYQAMGHAQYLTRHLLDGMDPQAAMDAPRWMIDPFTNAVEIETTVPAGHVEQLRAMGHDIHWAEGAIGGSQAIVIDWETGVLTGGSDPRKDGCAMGY